MVDRRESGLIRPVLGKLLPQLCDMAGDESAQSPGQEADGTLETLLALGCRQGPIIGAKPHDGLAVRKIKLSQFPQVEVFGQIEALTQVVEVLVGHLKDEEVTSEGYRVAGGRGPPGQVEAPNRGSSSLDMGVSRLLG